MLTRRHALRTAALAASSAAIDLRRAFAGADVPAFPPRRPPRGERRFTSPAVEATISSVKRDVADPELAWLFESCFPNTLDTTVHLTERGGRPDTFVITGDIEAMWLRDSTAQVWPYLPLAKEDPALRGLLAGVVRRQTASVLIDPYANAFNDGPKGSEWAKDLTEMKPELHERKWEIDSLCHAVRLAHGYWRTTGDTAVFDASWRAATAAILRTFREQQRKDGPGPYSFRRTTSVAYDTVPLGGHGNPARPVGLIHSAFRPSDDACIFPFLVPSNLFAVVSLRQLAEISEAVTKDTAFAAECRTLADEVAAALALHALVAHPRRGTVWAYEVDGFGNALFMDDANVPSLLSLPYLGCGTAADPAYVRTRRLVLSEDNPYFFRGRAAEGVGGPHVGLGMIWPLGITMRALTSADDGEVLSCLRALKGTHAGTGFMHESFHRDDPARFTRKWFAWANTLFGELVLKVRAERPHLLRERL
ncbi:MAG TPA: glycoside hydrolase family 125 protein [Vicinamibacteria bacterium]|nr:glycoside hydrolase family 125 protein [Vicinamibacteria bacterium]